MTASPAEAATEPRTRFRDLLAAEWIKVSSLRSTYWVLGLTTLAIIAIDINASLADYRNWPTYSAGMRARFDPVRDAFLGASYLFLMLAAGSVGAITIVGEYSSGLIRTTLAAVPARRTVILAKATVTAAVMTVVGTVIAVVSFTTTQAILSGRHAGVSVSHHGVPRALVASALLAPVCALIGLGLGALLRHSAATIVTTAVVLLLLPSFFNDNHRWSADIDHALPRSAWQHLVLQQRDFVPYPPTHAGSWIALLAWPLVATTLAAIAVHRRDL